MFGYEKDTRVGNQKPIETDLLHDRAREASLESRKILIQLCTGLLAFTFFVIIGKELQNLSNGLKIFLSINLVLIAICLMAGVIAWIADARRNYFKAKELQTHKNNKKFKERYHKKFKMWEKRRKKLDMTLRYGFIVSVFIYTFVIIAYLVSLK